MRSGRVVVAALLLVVAAACGDSASESTGGDTTATTGSGDGATSTSAAEGADSTTTTSADEYSAYDEFLEGLDPTGTGLLDVPAVDLDVWITDDRQVRRLRMGIDDLAAVDPTAPPGAFFAFVIDLNPLAGELVVEAPPAESVTSLDDAFGSFGD